MAFTKLETDLENISKLPDQPSSEDGYTAAILKALFDKAAVDIKNYINENLLPQLEAVTAAGTIGSESISGVEAENNIHSQLEALKSQIDSVSNKELEDGSITLNKLDDETAGLITGMGIKYIFFDQPGFFSHVIEKTGLYKITAVGAGAAGSSYGGGMSGCCSVGFKTFNQGQSVTCQVGQGGKTIGQYGTDSYFGTIRAQGGFAGSEVPSTYSSCYGSIFGTTGTLHTTQTISENPQRAWGGDSVYGRGARFLSEKPGFGGGGYSDGTNFSSGGNGFLLIEYIGA